MALQGGFRQRGCKQSRGWGCRGGEGARQIAGQCFGGLRKAKRGCRGHRTACSLRSFLFSNRRSQKCHLPPPTPFWRMKLGQRQMRLWSRKATRTKWVLRSSQLSARQPLSDSPVELKLFPSHWFEKFVFTAINLVHFWSFVQHSGSHYDHALLWLISLKPKQSLFQLIVQRQSCHVRMSWILFQPVEQQPKCNYRILVTARWNSYLGFQIPKEAPIQTVAIHILPCQPSKLSGVTRQLIELSSVSFRFSLQINHFWDFLSLQGFSSITTAKQATPHCLYKLPKPSANIKGWMVNATVLIGTNIKACIFYTPDGCFLNIQLWVTWGWYSLLIQGVCSPVNGLCAGVSWWVTGASGPTQVHAPGEIRKWELSTSTASPLDFHRSRAAPLPSIHSIKQKDLSKVLLFPLKYSLDSWYCGDFTSETEIGNLRRHIWCIFWEELPFQYLMAGRLALMCSVGMRGHPWRSEWC